MRNPKRLLVGDVRYRYAPAILLWVQGAWFRFPDIHVMNVEALQPAWAQEILSTWRQRQSIWKAVATFATLQPRMLIPQTRHLAPLGPKTSTCPRDPKASRSLTLP